MSAPAFLAVTTVDGGRWRKAIIAVDRIESIREFGFEDQRTPDLGLRDAQTLIIVAGQDGKGEAIYASESLGDLLDRLYNPRPSTAPDLPGGL